MMGTEDAEFDQLNFTSNEATDRGIDGDDALDVEGGGFYCSHSSLLLRNITWRNNNVSSDDPGKGEGGGIAAHGCVAALYSNTLDHNIANEAGGVLWRGADPLVLVDGAFTGNEARLNPYSSAILWGADSSGGALQGGGLELTGCTRFADKAGNSMDFGDLCGGGRRRLQACATPLHAHTHPHLHPHLHPHPPPHHPPTLTRRVARIQLSPLHPSASLPQSIVWNGGLSGTLAVASPSPEHHSPTLR